MFVYISRNTYQFHLALPIQPDGVASLESLLPYLFNNIKKQNL